MTFSTVLLMALDASYVEMHVATLVLQPQS